MQLVSIRCQSTVIGNKIIFIIAPNNGTGTDKSSQYLCSIPISYMNEKNLCNLKYVHCPAEDIVASGECGPDCSYTLAKDGTLTISGTGTVTKKFYEDEDIRFKIIKIVINEGIEKKAFYSMSSKSIVLPPNLNRIDDYAFKLTYVGEEIVLPESIEYYGKGIFDYTHIRKITFPSNMKEIVIFLKS